MQFMKPGRKTVGGNEPLSFLFPRFIHAIVLSLDIILLRVSAFDKNLN